MVIVCGINKPTWIIIFILLQILIFTLILLIINHDKWFFQKWTYNGLLVENFEGKLLHPGFPIDICTTIDTYKQCYEKCEFNCIRFFNWYYAGAIYIAIDSIVLVFCIISLVFLLMDLFNFQYMRNLFNVYNTSFFLVLSLIFHFLALSIWSSVVKVNYGDCINRLGYKNIERVCPGEGFNHSVALLIGLGVVNPCYYLISYKLNNRLPSLIDESEIGLV